MGKKIITFQRIEDEKDRRVCFKKRRIGLVKKAIQLSKLSDCQIEIKVYNPEGDTLLFYKSSDDHDLHQMSSSLNEYLKVTNKNEELINSLENSITSHGANAHNK